MVFNRALFNDLTISYKHQYKLQGIKINKWELNTSRELLIVATQAELISYKYSDMLLYHVLNISDEKLPTETSWVSRTQRAESME